MSYLILDLLNENELQKIFCELKNATWQDGLKSLSFHSKKSNSDMRLIKNNVECEVNPDLIHFALDRNEIFLNYTYALSSSNPITSKTPTGGYYNAHFDEPTSGHFSTTIFLNDPEEYDGGELVLLIDGEEKMFKLKPGMSITYETGIPHRVNEVTRGDRYVSVFWTISQIKDLQDLKRWRYYSLMLERYKDKFRCDDLVSFNDSLYTHFKKKCDKICKKYL